MSTRSIACTSIIVVLLLAFCASTAMAGGWAVITMDELPARVTAGQALTLGFTVRQHGRTLRDDLQPLLHFARADATESFTAIAGRSGASGHYTASITFPAGGQWNWHVDIEKSGMLTQDMPPLNVSAALATAPVNTSTGSTLPLAAGLVGLIGAGAGFMLWRRTRARWTLALVGMAVLVGVGGLIATAGGPALATANTPSDRTVSSDRGRALFAAKGCVMCHANAAVQPAAGPFYSGDKPAPDLTRVTLSDEYLRHWLKDPAALKPGTYMPNLNLKPDEIEALIAFLKRE